MKFSDLGKAGLCSLALAPLVGTSLGGFADSEWPMFIGLGVMLAAAGIFIAAQFVRSRRSFPKLERGSLSPKSARDKISPNLVALSSAAVLVIYGAGYLRTNSAARQFAEQSALALPAATAPLAPPVTSSGADMPPLPSPQPRATPAAPAPHRNPSNRPNASAAARPESPAPNSPRPNVAIPAPSAARVPAESGSAAGAAPPPIQPPPNSEPVAPAPIPTIASQPAAPAAPAAASKYKDGSYKGWGFCRHGDIEATVVIQGGKIVSAEISQCLTRYPCSVIKDEPGQVLSRQNATVDFVSGATQSGFAYHDAVSQALSKAE